MKTLDQIEPRTPVDPTAQGLILLNQPGVYYLTAPLTGANDLRIESGHVTLDLGGFAHAPSGSIHIQVSNPDEPVLVSNGTLRGSGRIEISGESRVSLRGLHFEGEGTGDALSALGNSVVSLEDSTIRNFERFSYSWNPSGSLEVSRCRFEKIRDYEWPERSRVSHTEIVTGSETYNFSIGHASRFEGVTVRSLNSYQSQYYGKIEVREGVALENCRFINQPEGLYVQGEGITIRNSALEFNTVYGYGQSGIEHPYSQPEDSVLLENVLISGYFEALSSGYYQSRGLILRDCEIAFNYVDGLEASNAKIAANDLGRVNTAALSDSSFQASQEGLSLEGADISRCSFTSGSPNILSGTGLRIENGGSGGSAVRDCSFSGFQSGLYSYQAVALSGSSFRNCNRAVSNKAAGSVIRDNTVVACDIGIEAGTAAVVTENTVSARTLGISGSGMIVKNMVMMEGGGPAYQLGPGTIGRQLRGTAINPDPNSPGEPWANIWEGM